MLAVGAMSPGARRESVLVFPLAVRGQLAPHLCPLSTATSEPFPQARRRSRGCVQDGWTGSVPAQACRQVLLADGLIGRREWDACSLQKGTLLL